MKFLKTIFFLTACGLGSCVRREYIKGSLLVLGFWGSLGVMAVGIQMDGVKPFIVAPAGLVVFLFVWIYNALETFDNKGVKRKKSKVEKEWQSLYQEGVEAYLKKDFDKAIQSFKVIVIKNKKDADAHFQLGKLYFKQGEMKAAKKVPKKYLLFDVHGKWESEAQRYLDEIEAPVS